MALNSPEWKLVREALAGTEAEAAFKRIEADVEKLVGDYNRRLETERDLRDALEEPTQVTIQRR